MKVLLGCLNYHSLTGSELYVYELSRKLQEKGCEVTIMAAETGLPLAERSQNLGIQVLSVRELKGREFDIIHSQHYPVTEMLCRVYPLTPKVCTIHSEIIALENPFVHPSIKKYIAIRPSITAHLLQKGNITQNDIVEIGNPIDEERFNKLGTCERGHVLFVGTLDYLRKEVLFDLVNETKKAVCQLHVVGNNTMGYLPELLKHKHVHYQAPYFHIENKTKDCWHTAGILLGRTTIEGWMCGKDARVYEVNEKGKITGYSFYTTPVREGVLEKYYSSNVTDQIFNLYQTVIEQHP